MSRASLLEGGLKTVAASQRGFLTPRSPGGEDAACSCPMKGQEMTSVATLTRHAALMAAASLLVT